MLRYDQYDRRSYLGALYPQGIPPKLVVMEVPAPSNVTENGKASDLVKYCAEGRCIHLLMAAAPKFRDRLSRTMQSHLIKRQFRRNRYIYELIGVVGLPAQPTVVMPLRRNIVSYANTVTFRTHDTPWVVFLKYLAGQLPGEIFWKGVVVMVGTPRN